MTVVPTGRKALEALKSRAFDAVLMDIQMPDMNGWQAAAEIRRLEAVTGEHVPIIAMTAGAMEGDREKCIAAGMDDYIAKPFQAKALLQVLLANLGRRTRVEKPDRERPPVNSIF